jgi:hypothetical protein
MVLLSVRIITKAKEPGSPQQKEGAVGVAPEEKAENNATGGAMHDARGAEQASGGGMKSGG